MKNPFIRELEQKQEMTVNVWRNQGKSIEQPFYIHSLKFAVMESEETYLRLLHSDNIKLHFAELEYRLGVHLRLSHLCKEMSVGFLNKNGILCYREYYGIMYKSIHNTLCIHLREFHFMQGKGEELESSKDALLDLE